MSEPTEAEVDAAEKAHNEFLAQILKYNEFVTTLGYRSAIRAALTAAAQVRAQESVVKPLTPEMEAARKEYMRWLAHNLHPWTAP